MGKVYNKKYKGVKVNSENILWNAIEEFVESSDNAMLVKGTHMHEKHKSIIRWLNENTSNSKILFVINAMQNITRSEFIGLRKQPKIEEAFRIRNNNYVFTTFNRVADEFGYYDFVIVYPIDRFVRERQTQVMNEINHKNYNKIFYVSCVDSIKYDFKVLDPYIQRTAYYDIEEDDPMTHKRIKENWNKL